MAFVQGVNEVGNVFRVVGVSEESLRINALIDRLAHHDATVFLTGEKGTGKGLMAREIHRRSDRAGKPFCSLDCSSLSEEQLEIALFGVEGWQAGAFERTQGGTLLLQNIDCLSLALQARLLWTLQACEVCRMEATEKIPINVRLIVSNHHDLQYSVKKGTFRKDLFFRLDVLSLQMPALRERAEDIPGLLRHFAQTCYAEHSQMAASFSPDAINYLANRYPWPGNVTELENLVETMAELHPSKRVFELQDLPEKYLGFHLAAS